ncbi:DUF4153 domain-containing protein [Clostridium psychrophilum]|uniref:DUF4153 domain-containing protein n=1 Tax=Clostridium psychrophilum TaxID=132926 RepID=UPI001C0D62F0|nr:DUF4153 domain-containing protein [Clostridium psychrophilum]MBU3181728.1 DUF4153 domain-containing protein [Clostridium psychrophilum]
MKLIKSIGNIFTRLYLSLKRFPLTVLLSASTFALLIAISEINPKDDTLSKITLILALGIPLSLCIKLIFEKMEEENTYRIASAYFGGGLILVLYYFLLLKNIEMITITRYIAVSLALYLAFIFIPYILKKEQFEMYVITIFTGFFITILYSIVLFSGLSAILFTIDKLLGIIINGKVYYYTWLFVVFIFALSHFLAGVPRKDQKLTPKSYPKLLRILILYIVMPLLTVYTIILYIYFGKIILTWSWPMGIVSNLVLWYSVIVTSILFFITPIREEVGFVNKFLKYAPKIILPLLIMMLISIGIRINAYGVTEKRYFVVILALWVFFIMLYFCFSKKLRNIIIPVTLSIVALISVFGPISSYSISKMSQNNRLQKILIKNNMIKNEKLQKSTKVSIKDRAEISSILRYFNDYHDFSDVKYLPVNFELYDTNKVLGFPENTSYGSPDKSFNFMRKLSDKNIDIKGYDYLIDMKNINNVQSISNSDLDVSYDYESKTIKINYANKEVYKKSLNSFVKSLANKYSDSSKVDGLPIEEMTLVDGNQKIKVKIVFINISGNKNQETQNVDINDIEFYLLVNIR